jgi:CHASE2 domain-containing sensor protein
VAETFVGTRAEVTAHLAALHARGELEVMTPPAPVDGRPGLWQVRYLTARPVRVAAPPPPARRSRRVVATVAGAALGVLAGLGVALVLLVRWLLAHPAALILAVAGVAGVVWLAAKVRGR